MDSILFGAGGFLKVANEILANVVNSKVTGTTMKSFELEYNLMRVIYLDAVIPSYVNESEYYDGIIKSVVKLLLAVVASSYIKGVVKRSRKATITLMEKRYIEKYLDMSINSSKEAISDIIEYIKDCKEDGDPRDIGSMIKVLKFLSINDLDKEIVTIDKKLKREKSVLLRETPRYGTGGVDQQPSPMPFIAHESDNIDDVGKVFTKNVAGEVSAKDMFEYFGHESEAVNDVYGKYNRKDLNVMDKFVDDTKIAIETAVITGFEEDKLDVISRLATLREVSKSELNSDVFNEQILTGIDDVMTTVEIEGFEV